jgi:hypothetical protein
MFTEYVKSIGLILPATLITMALEAVILARAPKTAGASMGGTLAGFLVFGLGFGFLAIIVYHWVGSRWPANATQVYLWIALGAAVLLTLLALIMPLAFKMPWLNVAIWTVENFIWALGYGLFLPRILSALAPAI